MRKKLLATVVCLACVSALTLSSNAAYFLGGKLNKGIYNRTYYIGCSSSSYVNACTSAIADWNWVLNPDNDGSGTDFYFKRVYTVAGATFRFWGESSTEQWAGLTRLYNSSGNKVNYTKQNWDYASIIFNTEKAPTSSADWMRSIANHEVGHAIGLAHNQTNQGVLMYQGYNVRTAIGPTGDEVRGAKALYN